MRVGVFGIVPLCVTLLGSPGVMAAGMPPTPVSTEMVILIPHGRHLAVFQQVVEARRGPTSVGLIDRTRAVHVIGGHLTSPGHGKMVRVTPTGRRFALRYTVPWNGQDRTMSWQSPQAVGSLLVLTPPKIDLPPVLNPAWQAVGQGRIPGVPNSPVFKEYETGQVHGGESLSLVLEKIRAGLPDGLYNGPGTYPWAGRVAQWMIGILALGAIGLATNGKRLTERPQPPDPGVRLLGELAYLRAAYKRGELAEDAYDRERQQIIQQLDSQGVAPDG